MDNIIRDVRFAARMLTRKPGFTTLAVLTLAFGIGSSAAMFTVLHQVVLRPLAFSAPEELVFINETSVDAAQTYSVSLPNFRDWRERNRSFQSLSAYRVVNFNFTNDEGPQRIRAAMVSGNFFATLDVPARLGTVFDDDTALEVVVSHRTWLSRFGGREDVVGELVTLDGRSFVVRGVMPVDFELHASDIEMWAPIGVFEDELPWNDRGSHPALWVVGRVLPGVSLGQAKEDMDRVAREIDDEFEHADRIAVTPLHERAVRGARGSLVSLMGAVGLLLLIACVNVANLILARASGRTQELATRKALGADGRRLVGQLLTESLLLTSLGGALGLLLASWGVELLKWLLPDTTPRLATIELNTAAVVFAVAVSVIAGLGFGLVPLLQANRSLRALMGARTGARGALVVAEVALAVMLLVGAGLLLKSFIHLSSLDAGFATDGRVAARFDLTPGRYGTAARSIPFYLELLDQVRALPGVRSAAVSTGLPLVNPGTESGILEEGLEPARENFVLASFQMVSKDYFETLGIRLLSGRVFDETDRSDSPRVVVVDETLAESMFPGESALGKRFYMDGSPENPGLATIVGVVRHVRNYQLSSQQYVQVYVALEQPPSWLTEGFPQASLVVRAASLHGRDLEAIFEEIRRVVSRLDPGEPIYGTTTLQAVKDDALTSERTNSVLSASFAIAALGLAALGLYGVLSSVVAQTTPEIGLRMALGATPLAIARAVVWDTARLVGAGATLGLLGAAAFSRVVASLVVGVSSFDPSVIAVTVGLVVVVALVAAAVPARRAIRIQAVDALRHE